MVDFQLFQKAWNQLSSQMNEMAITNKVLKKAVQSTYKRLMNEQKQNPKKTPNDMKTPRKTDKYLNLSTTREDTIKVTTNPMKRKLILTITRKILLPNQTQ